MATTTNFGWETPDDTDLVKDGAAAIRTALGGVDTSFVDLKGGTTGQVLAKASNTDLDFVWSADAAGISPTIVDAKGDLIAATAADTVARLPIGTNGQILTADSTASTGMKWASPAGGGKVLQVVFGSTATYSGSASATFADTGLTATITPSATTSKILVIVNQNGCGVSNSASGTALGLQIVRGATTQSIANSVGNTYTNFALFGLSVGATWLDSPSTTSATTYKTQFNSTTGSSAVFVQDDSKAANVNRSTITLIEIGA